MELSGNISVMKVQQPRQHLPDGQQMLQEECDVLVLRISRVAKGVQVVHACIIVVPAPQKLEYAAQGVSVLVVGER